MKNVKVSFKGRVLGSIEMGRIGKQIEVIYVKSTSEAHLKSEISKEFQDISDIKLLTVFGDR